MSDIFDEIKKIPPQDLENAGILRKAKRSGYICKCGNGTGDDGDGLSVQEYNWGYNYHCFGECGRNYTAVDLIGEYIGTTSNAEIAEWAKKEFGRLSDSDSATFTEKRKVAPPMKEHKAEKIIADVQQKDYSEFYQKTQNQLEEFIKSQGGKFRGLSLEDLQAVGAGIATAADLKAVGENIPASAKCLILPYSNGRFFMRSISDSPIVKRGNKGGKKITMYNPYKVEDFEKPFFVVEGEIDALSICAAGYPAVALSGAGEYKTLINSLADVKSKVRIIMLLDADKAGQENAGRAIEKLKTAGYTATNFILSKDYDANKYLQIDSDGLKARLTEIYRQANLEFDRNAAQIDSEQNGLKLKNYFRFSFREEVSNAARYTERRTGFSNIDAKQIFLPGLYVVGGLSALGKSTFAWQLLSQLAFNGEYCVYCSYEMSQLEMFAKSFCRELYKRESKDYSEIVYNPLTSADIRRGNFGEHKQIAQVISDFEKSDDDLRLLNLQNETIDTLLKKLKKICASTSKPMTICIDYLQIIPHEKDSAKAGVDEVVRKLKVFQREENVTFIIISSLNRMSYNEDINFSAFKESGTIEFSADTIWGLQLYFGEGESRTSTDLTDKKKKAIPRLIELKCLKNRNGGNYSCYFKYLPHVDTFISCDEYDLIEKSEGRTRVRK